MDSWLRTAIEQGGYWGVALLMLLETVFPPIPSEVIMSLAGFEAARGRLDLGGAVAAGTAGAMAGNTLWFAVARAYGYRRLRSLAERHGRWLTVHPEELDRAQDWFKRYGPAAVGIGRVLPTARSLISVPAGVLRMKVAPFLVYSTIGTALWTAFLAGAGYALGLAFADAERWIDPISTGIVVLIVALYVYRFATYNRRGAAIADS